MPRPKARSPGGRNWSSSSARRRPGPGTEGRSLSSAIVVLLALIFLLSRCFAGSGEGGYATETVRRGNLQVTVTATGNLQPTNEVQVGSEQSGLVTQVFVDNNDPVTPGPAACPARHVAAAGCDDPGAGGSRLRPGGGRHRASHAGAEPGRPRAAGGGLPDFRRPGALAHRAGRRPRHLSPRRRPVSARRRRA